MLFRRRIAWVSSKAIMSSLNKYKQKRGQTLCDLNGLLYDVIVNSALRVKQFGPRTNNTRPTCL